MVCADIEAMVKERRSGRVKRATVGLARWRRLTKCAGPIRRVEARRTRESVGMISSCRGEPAEKENGLSVVEGESHWVGREGKIRPKDESKDCVAERSREASWSDELTYGNNC